jgi:hypothetical protein
MQHELTAFPRRLTFPLEMRYINAAKERQRFLPVTGTTPGQLRGVVTIGVY